MTEKTGQLEQLENRGRAPQQARVYPSDALAANRARMDAIEPDGTLHDLFRERARRTPDKTAYTEHRGGKWVRRSWRWMSEEVEKRRRAIVAEGVPRGARAAIRMRNCVEWILYDQACMAAGLVLVPLYADDRADNIAYILEQTESELLLVERADMWREMDGEGPFPSLKRVIAVDGETKSGDDDKLLALGEWLRRHENANANKNTDGKTRAEDLATIVYTSGTTGRPKGVMLTHANILQNAHAGLKSIAIFPGDTFLSFLPLSHMFERTVGYCMPLMAGAEVAFNRSVDDLMEDLAELRPNFFITVPRIFERAHAAISARLEQGPALARFLFSRAVAVGWRRFEISQGRARWRPSQLLWPLLDALVAKKIRARFGGKLRLVVSGGAPLAPGISRMFIALGVKIVQGYGLTETGPTLSVNTLKRNNPSSVGLPFIGAEIRISERGELQARSPSVMSGYWRNEKATREVLDEDGWFSSGDIAAIDADGFISIVGRLKEIIVTATGEKVPPADMEAAICDHALFDQAMVLGEGRAFLSALVVLNEESWRGRAKTLGVDAEDEAALASEQVEKYLLEIIAQQLHDFPGYAEVHRVCALRDAWTVGGGALTPTMKIKRATLRERFAAQIENMYAGARRE